MSCARIMIPQKTPVLLFGEGKSEQGYGRWLNRIAGHYKVPVHIRAEGLKGSDPLDLVQQSIEKLAQISKSLEKYKHVGLLLDTDLKGRKEDRDRQAIQTANQKNISLIWQSPCHEAFILRHLLGKQNQRPPDCQIAKRRLLKEWPEYKKGMDAKQYGKFLTLDNLLIARAVEHDLNAFLSSLGWD